MANGRTGEQMGTKVTKDITKTEKWMVHGRIGMAMTVSGKL